MAFQDKETACAKAPRRETTWGVPMTEVAGTGYTDGRKGGGSAGRGQAMQGSQAVESSDIIFRASDKV